ncbi:tetratricopeptide repeat family [Microscilla marina ATCC 23134]|uniref:Tetratricopeptide repeat family n=2 Tax=Microscilla marina TaxID=1027 RepID=A1ZR00_MICM2|nr:tetratricopeptide repeat family [Microscilla marina ATCC 23134]
MLPILVTAQNKRLIDSLSQRLKNTASDKQKIELYNSIAWQYRRTHLSKNQHYAQQALQLSEQIGTAEGKAEAYYAMGGGLMESGKYDEASKLYHRVLSISKNVQYSLGQAKGYNGLGALHEYKQSYAQSIMYHRKSLEIKLRIGILPEVANSYYNIGNTYRRWEKYDSAAVYIHKATQMALRIGRTGQAADSYDILAIIKENQGKFTEALEHYVRAISLWEKMGNHAQTALIYNDKGYLYQRMGEFAKALYAHNKALALYKRINYIKGCSRVYFGLGSLYWRQNKYTQAIKYYRQALQIDLQLNRQMHAASAYQNIGGLYSDQAKYKEALHYYRKSLEIRLKSGNKYQIAKSYLYIGQVYKNKNEYNKARKYYLKIIAMKNQLNDDIHIAKTYYGLGVTYWYSGNYPKALDYYQKALSTYQKNNHKEEIARCYDAIGIVHAQQQNYALALKFLLESEMLKKQLNDKSSLIYCYNNIGNLYQDNHQYFLAKAYFEKALTLAKSINAPQEIANTYLQLGYLEVKKKNPSQAIAYFSKVKKMNNINTEALLQVKIYWGVACVYLKDFPEALLLLNEGLKTAQKQHRLLLVKVAAKNQAKAYEALGSYKKAYNSHQIFKEVSDSLNNVKVTRKITLLQARHTFNQEKDSMQRVQAQEKALFQNKMIQKDLTNRLQSRTLLFVSLGLLTTLLFAFYINKSRQVKQQLNHILINQQQELKYKNEILEMSKEEITTQRDMLEEQKQVLSLYKDRTGQSFRSARRIQKAFLPSKEYLSSIFSDFFVLYLPKDVVSGDFYWATEVNNTKLMVVGDCTGHGVSGAFTTMITHKLLDQVINVEQTICPVTILNKMQDAFQQKLMDDKNRYVDIGLDVTVLAIEPKQSQVQINFAGARQSLCYMLPQNNKIHYIPGTRKSIGGMRLKNRKFENHQILFPEGSLLYMGSDGLADQSNSDSKRFGTNRLLEMLEKNYQLSMKRQKNKLMNELFKYMEGVEQRDDILWVGVKL